MNEARQREALAKGNAICVRLKELGRAPVWMEATDDRIAIGFDIVSDTPGWTKAISIEAAHATPEAFDRALGDWKAKVRREIHIHLPSRLIQDAIAVFGLARVMTALEHKVIA